MSMRYSRSTVSKKQSHKFDTHDLLLEWAEGEWIKKSGSVRAAVALIGGVDHASLALRRAQAVARYDQQPSCWSHAVLLLPGGDSLREAVGLECALDPQPGEPQVPERNGVTWTSLARYVDAKRFPNLALLIPRIMQKDREGRTAASIRERLEAAAQHPMSAADRYPLWHLLGVWRAYVHQVGAATNPLLAGQAMPGAAWIEYLFDAVGFDMFPGTSSAAVCPEALYATMGHFCEALSHFGVKLEYGYVELDRDGRRREGLDADFEGDWSSRVRSSATRARAGEAAPAAAEKRPAKRKRR